MAPGGSNRLLTTGLTNGYNYMAEQDSDVAIILRDTPAEAKGDSSEVSPVKLSLRILPTSTASV